MAENAVTACKLNAIQASSDKWLDDSRHAGVEEVRKCPATRSLRLDVEEPGGWEVGKKDLTATRGLAADVFREVPDRHVDGVRCLVAELCQLRLVRRDDDGYDCRSRPFFL